MFQKDLVQLAFSLLFCYFYFLGCVLYTEQRSLLSVFLVTALGPVMDTVFEPRPKCLSRSNLRSLPSQGLANVFYQGPDSKYSRLF